MGFLIDHEFHGLPLAVVLGWEMNSVVSVDKGTLQSRFIFHI